MELIGELRSAPPDKQEEILERLAALRARTTGQQEAPRLLGLFLDAVGIRMYASEPPARIAP